MRVCFLVHGNAKIGMGHIMRSLSLAVVFKAQGFDVSFFSKYPQGIQRIKKEGIEVYEIPSESVQNEIKGFFYGTPEELETELEYIQSQITKKADVMVVDSYNVTKTFFMELRKSSNYLVYIDDLALFSYPVDILINGTASAFDMGYESMQGARLLLGMEYTLVRKEFHNIGKREVSNNIQNVLITTGNADPDHVTEKLMNILTNIRQFSGLRYHIIVGGGFDDRIWLNRSITDNRQVFMYNNPEHMAEIMLKCDLAIVAGGSTLYELMACGVPAVAFAYADNQLPHIRALERKGVLKYIGYYNHLDEQKLERYIKYLMKDIDMRKELVRTLQFMVDGNGCDRIVEEIEKYVSQCQKLSHKGEVE